MLSRVLLVWSLGTVAVLRALVINHDEKTPVDIMTYQTFSGVAMFAPDDAPAKSAPGHGESYIEMSLTVTRLNNSLPGMVEMVLIPDTNIQDIGLEYNDETHICCTPELVQSKKCDAEFLGKLIIKDSITGVYRYPVTFEKKVSKKSFKITDEVQRTGIFVFAMASCQPSTGPVTFEGKSTWMNPYGHLPGDVYGYMPFYGWMVVSYLCLGIAWLILNAVYHDSLLYVQNCITGVLLISIVEMIAWYADYTHLNRNGYRHHGPFLVGLILTVSRNTLARMLVVAVCLGYGVIKPTLGDSKNKLLALGLVYWVFDLLFESLIHYNQTEKVDTWMRVVLIPPVAVINGVFWWWTFVALNRSMESLKIRKQSAKLNLYKSFTLVLIATLLSAIGFAVYEMWYVLKEKYFSEWQRLWLMEVGFWQILFTVIFIAMMILWRPSDHNKHIQWSVQIAGDEDESEQDWSDDSENAGQLGFGQRDTMDDFDEQLPVENNPKFTIDDDEEDGMESGPDRPADIEMVETLTRLD